MILQSSSIDIGLFHIVFFQSERIDSAGKEPKLELKRSHESICLDGCEWLNDRDTLSVLSSHPSEETIPG